MSLVFRKQNESKINKLNTSKSEVITDSSATFSLFTSSLPNSICVHPSSASLLGSPLGDLDCVSASLRSKVSDLSVIGDRLRSLTAHDSIILLRYSFAIPKLMYLLRSAPCFRSSVLCEFDKCLCSIVSTITNVSMSVSDVAWKQATLPVWAGGLGFRSAVQLAPSAFLASATAATPFFQSILHCSSSVVPEVDCALSHWSVSDSLTPPVGDDAHLQRAWDIPHIKSTLNSLLEVDHAPTKARLFSVSTPESGAWLYALPLSAMGLRMDDTTIRVAVGLRLGLPFVVPTHVTIVVQQWMTLPPMVYIVRRVMVGFIVTLPSMTFYTVLLQLLVFHPDWNLRDLLELRVEGQMELHWSLGKLVNVSAGTSLVLILWLHLMLILLLLLLALWLL